MSYALRRVAPASLCVLALLAALSAADANEGSCTDPFVFGTTISATGKYAANADRWMRLTQVFEDAVNEKGGIKLSGCGGKSVPLKFVAYDDQSNPATAVNLMEKLATG